jgi:hypothetical protein
LSIRDHPPFADFDGNRLEMAHRSFNPAGSHHLV